jgi:hypothetical protein
MGSSPEGCSTMCFNFVPTNLWSFLMTMVISYSSKGLIIRDKILKSLSNMVFGKLCALKRDYGEKMINIKLFFIFQCIIRIYKTFFQISICN